MQVIIDFFSGVADLVVNLVNLLFAFIGDFISFLKLLTVLPNYFISFISWMPEEITSMLVILLSVVILYKILGREG